MKYGIDNVNGSALQLSYCRKYRNPSVSQILSTAIVVYVTKYNCATD